MGRQAKSILGALFCLSLFASGATAQEEPPLYELDAAAVSATSARNAGIYCHRITAVRPDNRYLAPVLAPGNYLCRIGDVTGGGPEGPKRLIEAIRALPLYVNTRMEYFYTMAVRETRDGYILKAAGQPPQTATQAAQSGAPQTAPDANCKWVQNVMVVVPRQDSVARGNIWTCGNEAFGERPGGMVDRSRKLYPLKTPADPTGYFVDIQPLEDVNLPEGGGVRALFERLLVTMPGLTQRRWSEVRTATPFVPTGQVSGLPTMVPSGLIAVPGMGKNLGPLRLNSRIITINGFAFSRATDFIHFLYAWDATPDAYNARHVLVTFAQAGERNGTVRATLLPVTPVADAQPGWSQVMADPNVRLFEMNNLEMLVALMAPFAAAYMLYEKSGMAEEDRQKCAKWRADGMPGGYITPGC